MSSKDLYLITDLPGFTPSVGRLVSMMNYTRFTTITSVEGLGVRELDYRHDAHSNSIGSLLLHIAAAEVGYQAATFYGRELTEEERHPWGAAIELGERSRQEVKGHELNHYLSTLEIVRATTLAELEQRDDAWLEEYTSLSSGHRVNNHFKWFHVISHELNHRGQIRWLRRRAATA